MKQISVEKKISKCTANEGGKRPVVTIFSGKSKSAHPSYSFSLMEKELPEATSTHFLHIGLLDQSQRLALLLVDSALCLLCHSPGEIVQQVLFSVNDPVYPACIPNF